MADRSIASCLLQRRAGLGKTRGDGLLGGDSGDNGRFGHDVAATTHTRPVPAALSRWGLHCRDAQLSRIKAAPSQIRNSRNTLSIQGQAQGAQW
jgi:hypothetical protein